MLPPKNSKNVAHVGFKLEKVHQDTCLLKEDTLRILLTFLIIKIGIKVTIWTMAVFASTKNSKNVTYVGFKLEKAHQDSFLLKGDTWRILLTFLILQIGVKVNKYIMVDFALSQGF